jgi:uncharacterized protein (TIGR02118 family)
MPASLADHTSYHRVEALGEQSKLSIPAPIWHSINVRPLVAAHNQREENRMAKVLVMYKKPKSAEAFDKHYASVHIPLAKKIPGLKGYDISRGSVATPAGASDIHLVATLHFDSMDTLKAGLGSAEGKAAAGDLANFADGGADLYFFDTKDA